MKNMEKLFKKYKISLSNEQEEQFDKYFSMLVETNKVLNLTAITDEQGVLVKHFLDSVLPYKVFPQNATVVDVGSGAGFPALPLKIIRPDLQICMVDSLNKRINFLNGVISELKLDGATAIHSRAEDFAKENREKFDVAVARAVAGLDTLVEYLLPLIKVGGIAVIYKSAKLQDEIDNARKAISVLGGEIDRIEKFLIEEENLERNILIVKKVKNTPPKYPRAQNKPKLSPIR